MNSLANALLVACGLLTPTAAQRLVASEGTTFFILDMVTAQASPVASVPGTIGTRSGMAYDSNTGELFFITSGSDSLYRMDLATGVATLIGSFGDPLLNMHGFEVDTSTGQLYGCSQHNDGFYAIDRTTGTATLLGTTGIGGFVNLGYDPVHDVMYAVSMTTDSLYTIDRTNGAVTSVGPLVNSQSPQALAFRPETGVLYLLDNGTNQLLAIDPETGAAWPVGNLPAGGWLSLAYLPGGNGSLQRLPHGCGNATLFAFGSTTIGGEVTAHLAGTTGIPVMGFGTMLTALPFCGCTVGHEWIVAALGDTVSLPIPVNPALVGSTVGMQGLDLFGVGGCADPAIVLTDTLVLTIG